VIVTDWAEVHLSWVSTRVDHYTVPTEEAARTCRAVGVPDRAVSVLGLPVRRQFARARPGPSRRRAARERFALPADRFVLLAMVGTEGTAGALAHLRALARTPLDAQLVVVCGRNERLRRRVGELGGVNPVRALGFVEEVADLMLATDLLVTKPGGVTLAEAFCCRLPVLAYDPLPGQEEGNARYVVARGAAELADSPRRLAELAAELRWAPARRDALAAGGAQLARPTAAANIVREILARATAPAPARHSSPPAVENAGAR
jgi:UDP-N-acetylglucosamine:LPS N-acetylglucosamine transferase